MAAKKKSPMDVIVAALEKDKNASYADVQKLARSKGHKIYPIMYGRAKAMLGLVPVSPRGTGKYAKKQRAQRAGATGQPAARRRGRPPKTASAAGNGSVGDLVDAIRTAEGDRQRMRRAIDQIREIVAGL